MRTTRVRIVSGEQFVFDVYCGRLTHVPFGWRGPEADGRFGNYAPGGTVEAFRPWFKAKVDNDAAFRRDVDSLRGKRLGCFCLPGRECHVDVIIEHLDGLEAAAASMKPITVLEVANELVRQRKLREGKL